MRPLIEDAVKRHLQEPIPRSKALAIATKTVSRGAGVLTTVLRVIGREVGQMIGQIPKPAPRPPPAPAQHEEPLDLKRSWWGRRRRSVTVIFHD